MGEVTQHNIRLAYGVLLNKRKKWRPSGATMHERLERLEKNLKQRTKRAVELRAKVHRPTKPLPKIKSYWQVGHSKYFREQSKAMSLLMHHRKKWKIFNTFTIRNLIVNIGGW